ncbi:PKD domain-containing protein [Nocardioides pelophilus]|uniref:PKD domain-containing protein n=1 Tax=Nocardioides pelophilus TaxID=2172019 RepID=UPI0015FEF07D|nr:PKD domain-containing protein [Nocardioides pelophilus]
MTLAGGALAALIQVIPAPAARAGHCYEVERTRISHGQVITTIVRVCPEHSESAEQTADEQNAAPPVGSAACLAAAAVLGLPPEDVCGGSTDAAAPIVTDGMVARVLRRIELPASSLHVQPPGGRTLVNFETNFFTTNDQPFTRTVQLLGRAVQLRIWPTSYTWHFGDGESVTTESPGARYPDLEVTHNYLEKGAYRPRVTTTYTAEWRVESGPWRPVAGTANIAGEPTDLRAIEARPTLVGYE